MRHLALLLLAMVASGCGTTPEFTDTNAQVDQDPRCLGSASRPREPLPPWCERKASATWSTESKGEKVDFGKSGDKDD